MPRIKFSGATTKTVPKKISREEVLEKRRKINRIYKSKEHVKTKDRVRSKTNWLVRTGKLKRKPCKICGETITEAHHRNYQDYLDIEWLCRKHHRELHKKLNIFALLLKHSKELEERELDEKSESIIKEIFRI